MVTKYLDSADSDWYKHRLTGALVCVLAAFLLLALRLFYLQVIEGEEFRRLSASNCIRLRTLDAPRGLIFDRLGRLLVDNRPAFDLSVIPKDAVIRASDIAVCPIGTRLIVRDGKIVFRHSRIFCAVRIVAGSTGGPGVQKPILV